MSRFLQIVFLAAVIAVGALAATTHSTKAAAGPPPPPIRGYITPDPIHTYIPDQL